MALGLLDSRGATIALGSTLATGGEGAVYELLGAPREVGKIYRLSPTGLKRVKLAAMLAAATPGLLSVATWPSRLLYGAANRGSLAGFVMPRLSGHVDAHLVYGQKSRVRLSQNAD